MKVRGLRCDRNSQPEAGPLKSDHQIANRPARTVPNWQTLRSRLGALDDDRGGRPEAPPRRDGRRAPMIDGHHALIIDVHYFD
jgi:hypothetical protein